MTSATRKAPPVNGLPEVIADRIGHLIARSHFSMRDLAEEALEPLGLAVADQGCTPKHVVCLKVIAEQGPLSQQTLGELIHVDRTTIVAVVDHLESAGFVERRRNPDDRRAYALQATAKGRRWLTDAWAILLEAEASFLEPLSAGERRQLAGLLRRLLVRA